MPRPFAVIGITVFLVLMFLSSASSKLVLAAFAVFTAALLISLWIKQLRRQPVFSVAFAGAAAACLLLLAVNELYYYPLLRMADNTYASEIKITDECEKKYGNYYFKGSVITAGGEKVHAKVYLCFSSPPDIKPYDRVKGDFRFYRLGSTDENTAASRKAEDRFLGAYPAGDGYETVADDSFHPGRWFISARAGLRQVLLSLLPGDTGGLCVAMLTGDSSSLSESAYTSLRKCGISHIICVSGLHLSLWTSAILFLFRKLRLGEKAACAATMPAVLILMFFMGMTYSVVRSGIMMLIYLLSVILSQRKDSLNSLGAALIIISVVNPFSPGHLGLQLSALSTMGIITAGEYLFPAAEEFLKKHSAPRILRGFVSSLLTTFSAVIFTLPVIFPLNRGFNFGVFPANLLLVIVAEICMVCAAFGSLVGLVSLGIFNLPAFFAGIFSKLILFVSSKLSQTDFLQFGVSEKDTYIILSGLFVFCALAVLVAASGKKIIAGAAFFLTGIFIISVSFYSFADSRLTRVTAFDTGNGSAVLISTETENVIIGCGGDSFNGAGRIRDALTFSGGGPDCMFVSGDKGRTSSYIPSLAGSFPPGRVYWDSPGYAAKLALRDTVILPLEDETRTESFCVNTYRDPNGKVFFVYRNKDISAVILPEPATDLSGFGDEIRDGGFIIHQWTIPAARCFLRSERLLSRRIRREGRALRMSLPRRE